MDRFGGGRQNKVSYVNGYGKYVPDKIPKKNRKLKFLAVILISIAVLGTMYGFISASSSSGAGDDKSYVIVDVSTPGKLKELEDRNVEIVHIYGYYALVRCSVSELRGIDVSPVDYSLHFQTGVFKGLTNISETLSAGFGDTNFYVVQLIGPATPRWLSSIKSYGEIYDFYGNYSYLVKINPGHVNAVRHMFFVKNVYPYQPEWKMHRSLYRALHSGNSSVLRIRVNVDYNENITKIANHLSTTYDAHIVKYFSYPRYKLAYAVMDVDKSMVPHILHDDYVISADLEHQNHLTNAVAARIVGVAELRDSWRNGLTLPVDGAGQVVAIADTGLDTGNKNTVIPDFAGRVLTIYDAAGDGDPSDPDNKDLGGHGTHVAGSVASSGVMSGADPSEHEYDGSFAGMAPEAKIHFESIGTVNSGKGSLSYDSITNMADRSYSDGARIWTNSWGSSDNSYTSEADELDTYMWNHKDFLILFAAGNSGPGPNTVGSPATAKDIITVGATETLRYEVNSQGAFNAYSMAQNPEELAYFSSRGPTKDGLIKPDVCAPGTGIISDRPSTLSDSNAEYTWLVPIDSNGDGKYDYGAMQGTSMATPITAGAMVLVRDYYVNVEGRSDPSAALLKATAIGGAVPLPGYKYGGIDQGYGRINIARALISPPPLSHRAWDWQAVQNGKVWAKQIYVKTDDAPLRVVLTWTDVNSGSGAGIVKNNLDLKLIAPNGTEYHGNKFVQDSEWSAPNPSEYDSTNVVEVVNVKNPGVGTWKVEVMGASIGTDDPDSHAPGSLDQSFAVFALGPFGNQSAISSVRTERFSGYSEESKEFTHAPLQSTLLRGTSEVFSFRVVNWGNAPDTYNMQAVSIPNSSDLTVSFDADSVYLSPGAVRWINATISSTNTISPGLYKVHLQAHGVNTGATDSLLINLQIAATNPIQHGRVTDTDVNEASSALRVDPTDGSLWLAYFRQNSSVSGNVKYPGNGNGDSYDLIVAHSTDGGRTWHEYVAYANINRFYNYSGSMEEVMDWFTWHPRMDVDSNGEVYVAFSNITSLVVVYGNENGWSHRAFETGYYTASSSTFSQKGDMVMVYPMFDIKSTGAGKVFVVYTYRYYHYSKSIFSTTENSIRVLKYTYTTDGGSTWSTPSFIGSYSTSDTSDIREYFPTLAYDGTNLYAFFSYKDPSSNDDSYYLRYYTYSSGSWSGPTTLYGSGTGGNETLPSAFVDSSGRIWVAWYSDDDAQNKHFGVSEHKIYIKYSSDGGSTWSGLIKVDSSVPGLDVNDYGPVPLGEDSDGNLLVGFVEENSYYTGAPHNENWVYYRYSMKMAIVSPDSNSVSGYRYIDYGAVPSFWLAGASYHGTMYFSYTKAPESYHLDVYLARYGSGSDEFGPETSSAMVYPYGTENATSVVYIDLVRTKSVTLSALVSDVAHGNSDISSAEYFIDSPGTNGSGTAMMARDGSFDSPNEVVSTTLNPFALSRGMHRIYVHARDSAGNWGRFDYIDVFVFASHFVVYGWVNSSGGAPMAGVAVNISDVSTGENVTVYTDSQGYYEYDLSNLPHVYSVGDTIKVYADDGTRPGVVDGHYYSVNSTAISDAPGQSKLNLELAQAVPEFGAWSLLLVGLLLIVLFRRRK